MLWGNNSQHAKKSVLVRVPRETEPRGCVCIALSLDCLCLCHFYQYHLYQYHLYLYQYHLHLYRYRYLYQYHIYLFSSVQSRSRVRFFATLWIAAGQASLSITNFRSSPKLMCIESVMSIVPIFISIQNLRDWLMGLWGLESQKSARQTSNSRADAAALSPEAARWQNSFPHAKCCFKPFNGIVFAPRHIWSNRQIWYWST